MTYEATIYIELQADDKNGAVEVINRICSEIENHKELAFCITNVFRGDIEEED